MIFGLIILTFPVLTYAGSDEKEEVVKIKIASLSFVPVKWDKDSNIKKIEEMAREAAANGAKILVTPEGAVDGYLVNEVLKEENKGHNLEKKFFEIAEPLDGPAVNKIAKLSRELNVDIILGILERNNDILYNSVVWIDFRGEILHTHRKTHMAQSYYKPEFYHPGDSVQAFDTEYGRFGMMICFERQIPEVASALTLDGARILFNPSYGGRGEWNDTMLRTRARDSNAYLIFTHPLQSLIIDPSGKIIINNNDQEGITYVEIKPDQKVSGRLRQRRPDVFIDKLSIDIISGYTSVFAPAQTDQKEVDLPDEELTFNISSLLTINNASDIESRRQAFSRFLFGKEGIPLQKGIDLIEKDIQDDDFKDLPNLDEIRRLTINMDFGLNSIAYHFIPVKSNKKVILYHQGHNGKFSLGISTITGLLSKGYQVIGFSMPLKGMNSQPIVNLERFGKMNINSHGRMEFLKPEQGHPVKYFVEPVFRVINYLQTQGFNNVFMTGISGGGWTTTLCAAMDTRIKYSYPVAGSLPLYLRIRDPKNSSWGDYEQFTPELYRIANYLELYVLGASGSGRRQIQILNEFDSCCFSGTGYTTYEDIVIQKVIDLGSGSFEVFLDSSHQEHKISEIVLDHILKDLER